MYPTFVECLTADSESERQQLFRWLSVVPHNTHHKTIGKDFLPNSGLWLQQKTEFIEWRKSSVSSILWLHGIRQFYLDLLRDPDMTNLLRSWIRKEQARVRSFSGRSSHFLLTYLRFSVIEYLKTENNKTTAPAPISYFYCARNAAEPERADSGEIMRSILKQLSCSNSALPVRDPVAKTYKETKEKAEENGCEPAKLSAMECVGLIVNLLESNPATIIIDALDECDPARRHELLTGLDNIIQQSASLVKVFVSSRDDNDIVCRLNHSPNLFIRASDNSEDIERFVHSEVAQCIKDKRLLSGKVSERLKSRITATLVDGAQGM